MRGKSPLFFVDKKREFVTMLDIGEVNDMNDKEMGKLSLILVENYWMTTVFSPEGLTKIDDKLEEISKATGIPLGELRKYAVELMKRLAMRFAKQPAREIRQMLGKGKKV